MISICIPAYEMNGRGAQFLHHSLDMIDRQTFTDYEVVVSDHSPNRDDSIKRACDGYWRVRYIRNEQKRGSSSANINNAVRHSKGDIIKILFQDDFLKDTNSLAKIADGIKDSQWLVHSYLHTDVEALNQINPTSPRMSPPNDLALGTNTIGCPSAIAYKRCDEEFDDNLLWLMDCEFYSRMLRRFGEPAIVNEPLVVTRVWQGSVSTSRITRELIAKEHSYVLGKICSL